jgi:hypothetical protein
VTVQSKESIATSVSLLTAKTNVAKFAFSSTVFDFPDDDRKKTYVVSFTNRLGWARTQIVTLPIATKFVTVRDSNGEVVPSQVNTTERNERKRQ